MRQDYVHILFVLDRSGSMESICDDTIGGFNQFVSAQKRQSGSVTLSLVQFDHEYDTISSFAPLQHFAGISRDTYKPRGRTALLNALGRAIRETGQRLAEMPEADRPGKVIAVVITDGKENASHEEFDMNKRYTWAQVSEMIKTQREKYSWDFVFLGADENAIGDASRVGISTSSTMRYRPDTFGIQAAYNSVSAGVCNLRSATAMGQSANFNFTDADRAAQEQS